MNESVLSECLMMLENSTYNFETPIGLSNQLGNREIAVSENLARQFGLRIGSKVFSKHNIKNKIEEYTVAEILPVSYGVLRAEYDINYGLIVMGCDSEYLNNTDYSYIGFSEKDPTALIQNSGAGLVSLDIKESYEKQLSESVFVQQGIACIMVLLVTVSYTIIHWRNQKKYYYWLKLKGCTINKVKKQILLDIGMPGVLSLFISFVLSAIIQSLRNFYFSWLVSLISITAGVFALLMSILVILQKEKRS